MTVEIREMIIRAVVREPRQQNDTPEAQSREDIVSECVEKVLEVLKDGQER